MNLKDSVKEAHVKIEKATRQVTLALQTIEDCQDSVRFWNKKLVEYYVELDKLQKKEVLVV